MAVAICTPLAGQPLLVYHYSLDMKVKPLLGDKEMCMQHVTISWERALEAFISIAVVAGYCIRCN